jgi:hypothetical protein
MIKFLDCPHRLLTVYPCRSCCKHGKSTVHNSDGIVQFLVIRSMYSLVHGIEICFKEQAERKRTIINEREKRFMFCFIVINYYTL